MEIGRLLNDAKYNIEYALAECASQTPEKALTFISSAEHQIKRAREGIEKIIK